MMAKKKNSNSLTVKCGVPQGSIMGPLLLIVYVNDPFCASDIIKPISFASDTNLFCSGKHIETLFQTANIKLEKIGIYFQANKLSITLIWVGVRGGVNHPSWFSLNNSKTVEAVTLEFCSIH